MSLAGKVVFTRALLPKVQTFDCGQNRWDIEVSDWIKAAPGAKGAVDDVENTERPCDVWLYLNTVGDIVGFGSLCASNWRWPTKKDPRVPINLIPNVAVSAYFQGKGYFSPILEDIRTEARLHPERHPILGLYVDPQNTRAVEIYKKKEFEFLPNQSFTDDKTGVKYSAMVARL